MQNLAMQLNNSPGQMCESQKHFILDKHLNFQECIKKKIKIYNKLIGTIDLLTFRKNAY